MMFARVVLVALLIAVAAASLEVRVSVDKTEVEAGEPLMARVSLLNAGSESLTLLSWFTPLEGACSDMFRLIHVETGRAAVYKGRLYKRQFPAPIEAYETLAAGEARHIELDLAESYHFLSDGAYQVSLAVVFSGFHGLEARLEAEAYDLELEFVSAPAALSVRGASPQKLLPPRAATQAIHPDAISYIACSSTQQTGLKNALPIAQSDATQAYNYMTAAKCNGAYVTWFGTSTSSRYSTVQTNWNKIVSQLKSNNYKFDCSCDKAGVYAYVYPFDPSFTIYLCPVFWTAPTGSHQFNSRPGTLTHETSHFKAVAGTDDIQYGEAGCKRLATTSPNDAIKNADSYEFFQESNPRC